MKIMVTLDAKEVNKACFEYLRTHRPELVKQAKVELSTGNSTGVIVYVNEGPET